MPESAPTPPTPSTAPAPSTRRPLRHFTLHTSRGTRFDWLPPALLLLVAAYIYNLGLDSYGSYHVDEGEWIFSGKLYTDLFFYQNDFKNPAWEDQLGTWGSFNPPIGKYLIGFSVNLFAGLDPFSPPGRVRLAQALAHGQSVSMAYQAMLMNKLGFFRNSFGNDVEWNRLNKRQPPPAILAAGRRGVVLCGLLAGLLVFLIARRLWGAAAGSLALALFLANPLVYAYSRRAMTDIPCLACVLLGVWLWLESLRALRGRGLARLLLPPLAGLAWGLALGVKLSALAPWGGVLAFTAAALAGSFGVRGKLGARAAAPGCPHPQPDPRVSFPVHPLLPGLYLFLLLCVLPPLVLVASDPFLYDHPLAPYQNFPTRFHFMLYLGQLIRQFEPGSVTATLGAKLARGARFLWVDASLGARVFGFGADSLLFLVALVYLGWGLIKKAASRPPVLLPAAFLSVSLATWLTTVLWLPLAWDRLLVPLLPLFVMVQGYGLAGVAEGVRRRIGKRAS